MKDQIKRPMATYRLQLNHDFRITDAQALVQYFSRLGVTHVYSSPILRARQASTHGYDVVDPAMINPKLGSLTDLAGLVTVLKNHGLGLILDIVPNHMAATIENPYWRDVLTYGPSSPFAGWFDIDWRMPDPNMWGRVLVPVLGEPRPRVLEQDQIRLCWSDGRFLVRYFDHTFPVDPATIPNICSFGLNDLAERLEPGHPVLQQLRDILVRLKKLPKLAVRLRRRVDIDREQTEQWLAEFAHLVVQSPTIQQWAEETAEQFGQGEDGRRRLRNLLDAQPYRLVHWRDAARTINYRRFFDINELVSVRQEDPRVFEDTHATLLRWVDEGLVDGLRIDHIDGLRDPLGYLERMDEALARGERASRPTPVFVEKILAPDEKLPYGWPVAGTTGYDFLNQVEAVFVRREGFHAIEQHYRRTLRRPEKFEAVAAWGKRRVLRNDLSPQVGRLADTLLRLAERGRLAQPPAAEEPVVAQASAGSVEAGETLARSYGADGAASALASRRELTKRDYVDAIVEVIVALRVYRTYVDSHHCTVSDADRQYIEAALQGARDGGQAAEEAIDFLGEVLLLEDRYGLPEHELHERVNFIQRFQQLTGPAAAKGIEDTALYAYVPLASLNEVGGEPHVPPDPPARLHEANEERAAAWPHGMLGVTTHDTKRTADVRARLDVLSEVPKLWTGLLGRWQRLSQPHCRQVGGRRAPDAVMENLFYQTVVGLWPSPDPRRAGELPAAEAIEDLCDRIEGYMLKAAREAKLRTSWTNQNREYEDALRSFVRGLLRRDGASPLLSDVQHLVARIARPGFWNSISRTLIQFAAPGTPDLYQGDELWNFAVVDPDNRRPVDYERRQRLLDEVITGIEGSEPSRRAFVRDLVELPEDGRIKLHVIRTALAVRHEFPGLFAAGRYVPLSAVGAARGHVLAFARVGTSLAAPPEGEQAAEVAAIVIVPRLTTALVREPGAPPVGAAVWSDTTVVLPEPFRGWNWTCALTREQVGPTAGGGLILGQALESFPAALLVSR